MPDATLFARQSARLVAHARNATVALCADPRTSLHLHEERFR